MANKKVYNVRIVENDTQKKLSLVAIISIVCMTLFIYLFFNSKSLYNAYLENNFLDVFKVTFKELLYSTGFSFVIYLVSHSFDVAKKQK